MSLKNLLIATSLLYFTQISSAQLPSGSNTPDFTIDDLNGTSQNLYNYLSQGKGAILDFSATWCGPCWNYHHSGNLDAVWNNFGPNATDEMMVFMIEADPSTSQPCIYGPSGCSGGSIGNWSSGTPYPILNPNSSGASQVNNDFAVGFWPTLYAVGPNYKIYYVGQAGFSTWSTWIESFRLKADYIVTGNQCSQNRTLDLLPSGGYGNLYYNWSNGSTSEDIHGAAPGDYYVTITDDHDYDVELGPFTVGTSQTLELQLEGFNDVDCFGDQSGFVDISISGNQGTMVFDWSNGETTEDIDNLSGGDYEIYATDLATGCDVYQFFTINEPPPLSANIQTTSAGCDGMSGQVTINPMGGRSPYRFLYGGNYTTTNSINNLGVGIHSIVVEDSNGCSEDFPFTIVAADIPEADISEYNHLNCTQPIATITADSSSVGAYIFYNWYILDTTYKLVDTGFQVQLDTAAVYLLEVRNMQSSCSDTSFFYLEADFNLPTANANSMSNIDCANSVVEISGAGSSNDPNHIYQWSTEDGQIESDPNSLNIDVSAAGTYLLEVVDTLNGCVHAASAEVLELLEAPELNLLNIGAIDCVNAMTSIEVESEVNRSYNWTSIDGIILMQNNGVVEVGAAGSYMLEVVNTETNCVAVEEYLVEESTDLPVVEANVPESITCISNKTQIEVDYNPDYQYSWSTTNGLFTNTNDPNVILASKGGSYIVDVINILNGCTKSLSITVDENRVRPEVGLEELGLITCIQNNPLIVLENNPNYSYEWSTFDGSIVSGQNSSTIMVGNPGEYIVSVRNNVNGCVSESIYQVEASLETPILELLAATTIDCYNNTANVSVTQNDNYSYQWIDNDGNNLNITNSEAQISEEGNYSVMATNSENGCVNTLAFVIEADVETPQVALVNLENFDCSGEGGIIEVELNNELEYSWSTNDGAIIGNNDSNLIIVGSGGTYTLNVIAKANGCNSNFNYEVEENNVAPNFSLDGPTYICNNEAITICVNGEQAQYTWMVDDVVVNVTDCIELSTAAVISVEALSDNGCSSTELFTVSQVNMQAFEIMSTEPILDCNITEMLLFPEMQNVGFNYEWQDDEGNVLTNQMEVAVFDAGSYTLIITEENSGCSVSNSFDVVMDDTEVPVTAFSYNANELSFQFEDITTGDYDNIIWEFGDGGFSSNQNPLYIYETPGYYTVCLTTSNKCGEAGYCRDVVAVAALQTQTNLNDVSCNGFNDGAISASFEGGIMPFEINWTGPAGFTSSELTIEDLVPGDYQLVIKDHSGLALTETHTISEPEQIKATATITDSDLDNKGSIELNLSGGVGDYEVVWDNGEEGIFITNLNPGDYSVTIKDENGCEIITQFTVGGITDVNEIESISKFELAPNPASSFVNVNIELDNIDDLKLEIHSLFGQIIYTSNLRGTSIKHQIDLSEISDGVYVLVIRKEEKITTKRIVVSK